MRGGKNPYRTKGSVDRDEIFARIQYFLEGVIPVAEEYGVQMACHLPDPPAPVLLQPKGRPFRPFSGRSTME